MEGAIGGAIIFWVFLFWVLPIILATMIAKGKGRSGFAGFMLGFFLGWIGVIITLCMTNFNNLKTQVNVQVGENIIGPSRERSYEPAYTTPRPTPRAIEAPQRQIEEVVDVTPEKKEPEKPKPDGLDEQIAQLEKKKKLRELQAEEERIKKEKEAKLKGLTEEEQRIQREEEEKLRQEREAEEAKQRQQELEEKQSKLAQISELKKKIAELEKEKDAQMSFCWDKDK